MKNINRYNIIKWYKMLTGKSILHVNQGIGKIYSKTQIRGYYNDLTEKVLKGGELYKMEVPKVKTEQGREIIFPVAVFQYGLGAYDLYLLENKELYLNKFKCMADWALNNQKKNGAWDNFFFIYPDNPYSAMAQGEGASLLIRAYIQFEDNKYLVAAKNAIDFMLLPVEDGGTTLYEDDTVVFLEYTMKPAVMNGWIFAWWGLYDLILVTSDEGRYKELLDSSCQSLIKSLSSFSCSYWSMYDLDGKIASPFYHNLHIAQMQAMFELTRGRDFQQYASRWLEDQKNWWHYNKAFMNKVIQKIKE